MTSQVTVLSPIAKISSFVHSFVLGFRYLLMLMKLTLNTQVGVRDGGDPIRFQSWIYNMLERDVVDLDLYIHHFQRKSQPVPSLIF